MAGLDGLYWAPWVPRCSMRSLKFATFFAWPVSDVDVMSFEF